MSTQRSLAVLVLLVVVTPSRAPTPPPPSDVVSEGIKQAKGFFSGFGLFASDNTDAAYIEDSYNKALKAEKDVKDWSCVRGLFHEVGPSENMKAWGLKIKGLEQNPRQKLITVEVKDVKSSGLDKVTTVVRFKFPSNMIVTSKFEYNSSLMMVAYSRSGTAKFKIGSVTVEVPVTLPSTKTAINEVTSKQKDLCQNKISPSGIKTMADGTFTVEDVDYPSATGMSYSKSSMTSVFQNLKKDIILNVSAYLERYVANVVNKVVWSCLDDPAKEKWKPANSAKDCMDYRLATNYGKS